MSDAGAAALHPAVSAFESAYRQTRRRRRAAALAGSAALAAAVWLAARASDFGLERLAASLPRIGDYFRLTLPQIDAATFAADVAYWYYDAPRWLGLLFDTVLIGTFATMLGAAGGIVLSFAASRNLVRVPAAHFVCRRALELARTVPEAVYALVFVVAFGVGPLAGIAALALHSAGALGKLCAEVNEHADTRPFAAVRACGGGLPEIVGFGLLPQVTAQYVGYTLWRLELNIRSAAIIGFVGAGGIGQELYQAISLGYYEDVSAIALMIVLTVTVLDLCCERLRHRLIGGERAA